jgi:uncharacterized protein (DUF427 family)
MTAAQQIEELDIGIDRARLHIEASPRWIRAFVNGVPVANSRRVLLVFEPRRLPLYYFPIEDVRADLLKPSDYSRSAGEQSGTSRWNLELDGRVIENIGWSYRDPDAAHAPLKDHIAFYWGKLDAWFEEDEEVFVHPRDPYKRIDAIASSRDVRVVIDGVEVAHTQRPTLLFETGLPTRYYLPRADVRLDLLESTDSQTQCPYKGKAVYWSVRAGETVHKDVVWSYPFPIAECPKIEKLMAFYNEKVDLYVDGQLQERPKTPWS